MSRNPAIVFANELRSARLVALADAEAFDGIIHVVERIGGYLCKEELGDLGKSGDLSKYKQKIRDLAKESSLFDAFEIRYSVPFENLYEIVRIARNDALHQGAFARHLTVRTIELAIILEDALSRYMNPIVSDFMIRTPLCAELWQPIGYVRQQMLSNSYSFLPVLDDGKWQIISDRAIARFLGPEREGSKRRKRLSLSVKDASVDESLQLLPPAFVNVDDPLKVALDVLKDHPVLLVVIDTATPTDLVGMLTAFDVL